MSEKLLSVGLDVGTTSTQLVVSCLRVENRASGFAVPEMEITQREILYRSPVYFTPLLEGKLVDGAEIRRIVEAEYEKAGISRLVESESRNTLSGFIRPDGFSDFRFINSGNVLQIIKYGGYNFSYCS